MTGPENADRLRQVLALRSGAEAAPGPNCLDDDTVAALAEGGLGTQARSAGLAHLATCGRCRRAVASVARALADPEVARGVREAEHAGRLRVRRFGWTALGAAAAAAALLIAWPPPADEPLPPHRALPITAAPAPVGLWPVGLVDEARGLRWTPVAGADRYRVTLFDADGSVRYEAELDHTEVALPDSVLPKPGETLWWEVDARLGFDRWASSDLIEFSVGRGRR
jgi:hypothetical protein